MDELDDSSPADIQLLRSCLSEMSDVKDIATALGIKDTASQPVDFWDVQRRTARARFLGMCLERCGLPLSLELDDLTDTQAADLAETAEALLDSGVRYAQVRAWYLQRGALAMKLAFDLRRERRKLAGLCLRVLLVFDKGAKYVAYGPGQGEVRLVESPTDAYAFPVNTTRETEKAYLAELAGLFDALKADTGAREVKVLCCARA